MSSFDAEQFFHDQTHRLRREQRYRVFRRLVREHGEFPRARWQQCAATGRAPEITVWCSNDYLGMSQNPRVIEASTAALARYGAGAGGTRNISGTHDLIAELETELAQLHGKGGALVFSSGYVANDATLATLGSALPHCMIFSDAGNHASMIEGMRRSGAARRVFAHNDPQALASALRSAPRDCAKLVAFESLYSMDGDIAPLAQLLNVAREYGALTFVDETHAVGVYGLRGGGLLQACGLLDQVDFVQGGLGKGYGVVGGFVTASAAAIDFLRGHATGFIFTTALPPAVAAGALASVRHLSHSQCERRALFTRVSYLRKRLRSAGLPLLDGESQILPLMIGDATRCSDAADRLLQDHGIYLQAINYPTVARGSERLRITPSPLHTDTMQEDLLAALLEVSRSIMLSQDTVAHTVSAAAVA